MTYWTLLVIVYGVGPMDAFASTIPYPTMQACGDAMVLIEPTLLDNFPDLSLHCMESNVPYSSIRPKQRPEGLNE